MGPLDPPLTDSRPSAGVPTEPNEVDPRASTAGAVPLRLAGARPALGPQVGFAQARLEQSLFGVTSAPARIGKYFVLGLLGRGGMGSVYTVYNPDLDRKSVIKLVRPDHSDNHGRQRLLREARLLAALSHPNVVQVHDSGLHDSDVYVVMEFIAGLTLEDWRKRGPHPWRSVLAAYRQAGLGLAAAHARGIVHRDFTPRNAMLDDDGRARVLDFGLSHDRQASPATVDAPPTDRLPGPLTQTGAILGTPRYMSPEQLQGRPTDPRTDQFGFCVCLWEALFDQLPFDGTGLSAYNEAVLAGRIRAGSEPRDVPPATLAALRRGLSVRPEDRFPDMHALLAALEPAIPTPHRSRATLAGALALTLFAGAYAAIRSPDLSTTDRCAAAAAEAIASVWNNARRVELRGALADTGAGPATEARLDALATAWTSARTSLCGVQYTGRITPTEYGRGLTCLAGHRDVLDGVIVRLAAGGVSADLDELPDPERLAGCADPRQMSREIEPASPAGREEARRIAHELSEAQAALIFGDYVRSEQLAAGAVRRARALGHGPTLAAALYHLARPQVYGPNAGEAMPTLQEAALLAERHELDELAADIDLRALRVASTHGARPDDASVWFDVLLAKLERLDDRGGLREAEAHEFLGNIALLRNDGEAALAHFEASAEGRSSASGFERSHALVGIGRVLGARGAPAAALPRFEEALALAEAERGEVDSKLIPILLNLVDTNLALNDPIAAGAALERAERLLNGTADRSFAPTVAHARARLAAAIRDPAGAHAAAEQARKLVRAAWLPRSTRASRVSVLDLCGQMAFLAGLGTAALDPYVELLSLVADPIYGEPIGLTNALTNAAEYAAYLDRPDLALRLLAAAKPMLPGLPPPLAERREVRLALAEGVASITLGRHREAQRVLEAALARWDPTGVGVDDDTIDLLWNLVTATEKVAPPQARTYAVRARKAIVAAHGADAPELPELDAWLREHPR